MSNKYFIAKYKKPSNKYCEGYHIFEVREDEPNDFYAFGDSMSEEEESLEFFREFTIDDLLKKI